MPKRRKKGLITLRTLHIWHKYMGLNAAVFVLLIAITGLLLNHTEELKFDSQHIQSEWVLDWYGIKAPEQILSFQPNNQHITLMGEDLYLNTHEVMKNSYQLAGAVWIDGIFVVAINNSILLLTQDGEHIDFLGSDDGVPTGIRKMGLDVTGSIVVQTDYEQYQPNADFLRWQRWDKDISTVGWVLPMPISTAYKHILQQHFRSEVLPVERVLLDLHSGRFFGQLTVWIFDIAAILMILLTLSGTWAWLKRKKH